MESIPKFSKGISHGPENARSICSAQFLARYFSRDYISLQWKLAHPEKNVFSLSTAVKCISLF